MFNFGVNSGPYCVSAFWEQCFTSNIMQNYFCTKLFLKFIYANFEWIASVVWFQIAMFYLEGRRELQTQLFPR